LTQVDAGAIASYIYDPSGNRVRKNSGGSWTEYFYDAAGSVTAEHNSAGWPVEYVYVGGQLVAQYRDSTTYSIFRDHLGSTRLITKLDISSTGVTGTTFVCEGLPSVVIFSCRTPFSLGNRRKTITWNEIDRVECVSRHEGTIGALCVYSKTQRIEIGSFAVRDLSGAHDIILANAPPSATRPCQTAF
jgi:YD repeat-containing protein